MKVIAKSQKEKEEKSRRGRTSRNKGSNFEREVAKIFKEKLGIELVRTPLSGGFGKSNNVDAQKFRGDVVAVDESINFKLHIEAKNQKTWALPAWLKQAEEDCPEDKTACVVFHKHGTSKNYITLSLDDFLSLIDPVKVVEEV